MITAEEARKIVDIVKPEIESYWAHEKTSKTAVDNECYVYPYGIINENLSEKAKLRLRTDLVDWNNVPIDAPVFVCNYPDKAPIIRHFAGTVDLSGTLHIATWRNGRTHWTHDENDPREFYRYGYLVEG